MTSNDELLTIEEVAEILGVKPRTMYAYRSQGKGPKSFRRGRELRYRREDVDAYLEWERDSTSVGGVQ